MTPVSVHSEMMDRVYRRQRHIYDLSRKFFLLGRDRLIGALKPPPGGQVLEIGCGTARNLHVVDFGQQEGLPRWFRAGLFEWLDRFHVAPRAELERVLSDVATRQGGGLAFRRLYRGYAWSAELSAPTDAADLAEAAGTLTA